MNYSFSIITPTHSISNIPYLIELYNSIKSQTYSNWEWVIVVNGQMSPDKLPDTILENSKVKCYHLHDKLENIGHIKNIAFSLGTNDILVEVDHDDLITPDCLEELNIAYQNLEVGFVYSDTAMYDVNKEQIPYNTNLGWTSYRYNFRQKECVVNNTFEPSSHSVGFIWYAPDHVRSWRKTVYTELGGYNKDMWVCEDHELMIRTYLHTKMKKIQKPLYIYRITGENTSINKRNEAIQIKTVELFRQYAIDLAERDALNNELKIIELGDQTPRRKHSTIIGSSNAHILYDLNKGIPLDDNSVGVIIASHILQKLKDPMAMMKEIYRVLAHGGWVFIEVPSTDGRGAFQDPTNISYFNENSFLYYTNNSFAKFLNTGTRFQQYKIETYFANDYFKQINCPFVDAWLVAIKGPRRFPGALDI